MTGPKPGRAGGKRATIAAMLMVLPLALFPSWLSAEVTERLEYENYFVHAADDETLLAAMDRVTPVMVDHRKYHGFAKWNIDWKFRWRFDGSGRCWITSSAVDLNGTIVLPKLIQANALQRNQFETYIGNLETHELGHFEIGRRTAQAIDSYILNLPEMNSCAELEKTANDGAYELLERGKREEAEYDVSTEHGVSQGASFL